LQELDLMNALQYAWPRLVAAGLLASNLTAAHAAATFFGPTPYLSVADIPAGFYGGGVPTLLDNLEDGALDASISASNGSVIGPGSFNGFRDSVDADDGSINGTGTGRSWFSSAVTFTYAGSGPLPTAFGLVWTDGSGKITFSAKDGAGQSLGSQTFSGIPDNNFAGGTAEDRFFGVQFAGGVKSITIAAGGQIEVDHIQYGQMAPVPEPESWAMLLAGLASVAMLRFKATRKPSA
jgi:PEP-CTERM motif